MPLVQQREHIGGIRQVSLALGGQPQAARGAHEQAQVQFPLQPLDGGADLPGRQIGLARGAGKAAERGTADKQVQVLESEHRIIVVWGAGVRKAHSAASPPRGRDRR
ncbi:hypothetical protein D3C71_1609300 [compost metagenome]